MDALAVLALLLVGAVLVTVLVFGFFLRLLGAGLFCLVIAAIWLL